MFCQIPAGLHNRRMKLALQITAAGLCSLFLASCGSTGVASNPGNHPSGTGPFDSRGNYIEDWADSPSKWKKNQAPPSKPGESLHLATNDEPPMDAVPIPTAANTPQPGNIGSAPVIVSRPTPSRSTSNSNSDSGSSSSSTRTASKPVTSTTVSKPKPKPQTATASKSKPKAATKKTVTTRYTVKRGDTLSGIASRFGTTVGGLQRANGIKGALIQPGKALIIPK